MSLDIFKLTPDTNLTRSQSRSHIPVQSVCNLSPPQDSILTIPLSFLQMSGMAIGSMIEADKRLRLHEVQMRRFKRTARDAEVWRRYEEDFNVRQSSSSPSAAPDEKAEAPKDT